MSTTKTGYDHTTSFELEKTRINNLLAKDIDPRIAETLEYYLTVNFMKESQRNKLRMVLSKVERIYP